MKIYDIKLVLGVVGFYRLIFSLSIFIPFES